MPLLLALEAQKKIISFYAVDLSLAQLQASLQAVLARAFHHVRISALHGTFEDALEWLNEAPAARHQPRHVLLFGLTIGNYSPSNAASFLRDIAKAALDGPSSRESSILVTMDSCTMPTKVLRAYTCNGIVPFALQALTYGNLLFKDTEAGAATFNPEEWYYHSEWNHKLDRHEAYLIPRSKTIKLGPPLDGVAITKSDKVRFACSYKYDEERKRQLFADAGLKSSKTWQLEGHDIFFHQLQLSEREAEGERCEVIMS